MNTVPYRVPLIQYRYGKASTEGKKGANKLTWYLPTPRFMAQNIFGSLKKKITCGADRHQWQRRRDLWPPWTHFSWSDRSLWASVLGLCPAICHPFLKITIFYFKLSDPDPVHIQFLPVSGSAPRFRIQAPDPHSCWSEMIDLFRDRNQLVMSLLLEPRSHPETLTSSEKDHVEKNT